MYTSSKIYIFLLINHINSTYCNGSQNGHPQFTWGLHKCVSKITVILFKYKNNDLVD